MAVESIDRLAPQKSLIDLSSHSSGDFGLDDYQLDLIFDDVILTEYVDLVDSDGIMRRGIYVPTNTLTKAWRKAKVILVGPDVKYTKKDDIVIFPNNLGIPVSNIMVKDYGKIKQGIFINENRLFGICNISDNGNSDDTTVS